MPPVARPSFPDGAPRPALSFPLLAALGYAGGVAAYLPLLTLLLPLRVERIAGAGRFELLAAASVAGAVTAGAANILFGWLSDRAPARERGRRGRGRRGWMAAGLAATLVSYGLLARAATPVGVVLAVMAFQLALNAVLAPLTALIAEEGAEARKGLIGGLLAAGPPFASLLSPLLVRVAPDAFGLQLALVGAVVAACILPLLLGRPARDVAAPADAAAAPAGRRAFALAGLARLLVQVAGTVLFAYLLYVMEGFAAPGERGEVPARIARLILLGGLLPLPVAVLFGGWADGGRRHRIVLAAAAAVAAAGLVIMAAARGWTAAATGFCVFSVGWGSFMPLQVGFIMKLLPDPRHRGRDLGIMNLANVLPVLLGQALAWLLARPGDVSALLETLAGLTLAGGLAMLAVAEPRVSPAPESR